MARRQFQVLTDDATDAMLEDLGRSQEDGNLTAIIADGLEAEEIIKETVTSGKLVKKEELPGLYKISCILTEKAKENLDKYAAMYGYRKISPFVNDLLEHLDAYLDEE